MAVVVFFEEEILVGFNLLDAWGKKYLIGQEFSKNSKNPLNFLSAKTFSRMVKFMKTKKLVLKSVLLKSLDPVS
jgi:hypothetical protein